jgi:hypothetical protein
MLTSTKGNHDVTMALPTEVEKQIMNIFAP